MNFTFRFSKKSLFQVSSLYTKTPTMAKNSPVWERKNPSIAICGLCKKINNKNNLLSAAGLKLDERLTFKFIFQS
jgi:hypothetical protein